jgi:hypothetical protein
MNTKAVGEISEGIVIAELLKRGYSVSVPFGNNQRYDLILDDGHRLIKVQVKTGRLSQGCVIFQTVSKNGFTGEARHYRGQVELFLVYCPQLDTIYSIPVDLCGLGEVRLRVDPPVGGNVSKIKYAKDYVLAL